MLFKSQNKMYLQVNGIEHISTIKYLIIPIRVTNAKCNSKLEKVRHIVFYSPIPSKYTKKCTRKKPQFYTM